MNIQRIYAPISRHFRIKRMAEFARLFDPIESKRILDVGGLPFNWTLVPVRPGLTILNLPRHRPRRLEDRITWVGGDGRYLPFRNRAFDIVYSNSVIEHLGDLGSQERFAAEVRRVGVAYYIQTPNRWFPIEPHYLTPIVHFFPKRLQKRLVRRCTVWGLVTHPSAKKAAAMVDEIRLLDEESLQRLFPEARIYREKTLGLTKSLIAVFNPR